MRNLKVTSNEEAAQSGWEVVVPLPSTLIGKAVYTGDGVSIMKSTKAISVAGGTLYNTTTEYHDLRGRVSVAEALAFVPNVA